MTASPNVSQVGEGHRLDSSVTHSLRHMKDLVYDSTLSTFAGAVGWIF